MGWGDGNGSLVSVYLLIMPFILFKNIFIVNYQYFSVPSRFLILSLSWMEDMMRGSIVTDMNF